LAAQKGAPVFTLRQNAKMLSGAYSSSALREALLTGTAEGSNVTIDFEVEGTAIRYVEKLDGTHRRSKRQPTTAGKPPAPSSLSASKPER
jgi:hypothetical protein